MSDTKFVGTPRKATSHVNQNEDLIFEKSSPGKKAYRLSELDVPAVDPASLLGDAVRTDLRTFVGEADQADDITLLAVRWLGPPGAEDAVTAP